MTVLPMHCLLYLVKKSFAAYDLRRSKRITVLRFNSYFLKNSISHRGAILWNAVCTYYTGCQFKAFYHKVKKDRHIKDLDFSAQSVQSIPRFFQDAVGFYVSYCHSYLFNIESVCILPNLYFIISLFLLFFPKLFSRCNSVLTCF